MNSHIYLIVAGSLSSVAALLHVAVIFGGPDWYRFFGAGEQMAQMAEAGSLYPAALTAIIAAILFVWGLYGFSAVGLFYSLPLMKIALPIITSMYLVRGIAGLTLPFFIAHPALAQNSLTFWVVSSLICLCFGGFYLAGTISHWAKL